MTKKINRDHWTDEQIAEYNRNPYLSTGLRLVRVGSEVICKSTASRRKLVKDPNGSGELVLYGTAYARKLVPDPNGSDELVPYSTARKRKQAQTPEGRARRVAESQAYDLTKEQRIPSWVDEEEMLQIRQFYELASILGFEVDHILPLHGVEVSGFHCLSNLNMLTASENMSKSNRLLDQDQWYD